MITQTMADQKKPDLYVTFSMTLCGPKTSCLVAYEANIHKLQVTPGHHLLHWTDYIRTAAFLIPLKKEWLLNADERILLKIFEIS